MTYLFAIPVLSAPVCIFGIYWFVKHELIRTDAQKGGA